MAVDPTSGYARGRGTRPARGLERPPPPARAGRRGLGGRAHAGQELPARAERIRAALGGQGARWCTPSHSPTRRCPACTTLTWSGYLARGLGGLGGGGADRGPGPGSRGAVPLPAPWAALGGGPPGSRPRASARAGQFAYDTMTLIGPGTWEAARAALDAAVTAADLVLAGAPGGLRLLPPARPSRDARLLRRLVLPEQRRGRGRTAARGPRRAGRRARHRRPPRQRHAGDLLRRPRCAHRLGPRRPRRRLVSPLPGLRGRDGSGGRGANRNLPLPPGTGDEDWVAAVAALAEWVEAGGARRWWWRSAWTPRGTTRRAR